MEMGRADLILHGHTHLYRIEKLPRGIAINPGHLKPGENKGRPPTFAIVDIEPKKVHAQIIELDGGLLDEATFTI